MKRNKKIFIILLLMVVFSININVNASSGSIKQSTVIKCEGVYYGAHGSPMHWHKVKKDNGKWVSVSSEVVSEPSCYGDIANETMEVTLSKCVDGDTAKFVTSDGEVKTTRFLAIDTPESVHPTKEVEEYGKEASNYTCNLLTKAKKITLEFDKNSDKEDKYGRLLAFVYADDKMIQEELIKVGYAKVAYLYADYTHTEKLKKVEKTAKNKKIGIWNSDVTSIMEQEEEGEVGNSKKESKTEKETTELKEAIYDEIWVFIKKILSKLFNYLENVL